MPAFSAPILTNVKDIYMSPKEMQMTPAYATDTTSGNWLTRITDWLDARGKPAWIASGIMGLVLFWPVGIAVFAYAAYSRRIFSGGSCAQRGPRMSTRFRGTGNAAFDAYKHDMLRRLEEEQEAFETFLQRLREAKDKAEFDQFMEDRAKKTADGDSTSDT